MDKTKIYINRIHLDGLDDNEELLSFYPTVIQVDANLTDEQIDDYLNHSVDFDLEIDSNRDGIYEAVTIDSIDWHL